MALWLLFVSPLALAGTVRTIYIDSTTMSPINLRLGKSTVLRFPEKPKKVILGNSNYYTVEFIDNDVALQPQGSVPTNLFVYGPKSVFGFLLQTTAQGAYDDLVQVKWKEPTSPTATIENQSAFREVSRPGFVIKLGKDLNVAVLKIQRMEGRSFYILDLAFQNPGTKPITLQELEISATNQKVKLSPQDFFLKSKNVEAGKITYGRLFLNIVKKKSFSLAIRFKGKVVQQVISEKLL